MGLKEAKDLCEIPGDKLLTVNISDLTHHGILLNEDTYLKNQCNILRSNGCIVGPTVHVILQELRGLATQALDQGDDELANEIIQLVLAEKLRRT